MRRPVARWLCVALLAAPALAPAAEITDVATAFEADNPFDFRLRFGYEYTTKTAAIKREHEGAAGQDKINIFKDLVSSQQRHALKLRAEFSLYTDLMVSIDLPVILSDSRSVSYDTRKGSECIYKGAEANCVNGDNSMTTNSVTTEDHSDTDPSHYILPNSGFDAQNKGNGFDAGSNLVFRGPKRGGDGASAFDTLNFALTYAILSQRRDATKPTWTLSAEYRLSVGNVMKFDRTRPEANTGVADGLDHFMVKTAMSRRFKWIDPYIQFWFDYPFARRDDTLFVNLGPKAKNQIPQIAGGTIFGLELIALDRPAEQYKIAFDLAGRIQGKFDGRGYSEAWEIFASSPALECSPMWNPACDPAQTTNVYQGKAYSGLTTIENYATIGAHIGLNMQVSKWVRFRAYFDYQRDQAHFITVDDVGRPDADGQRVSKASEYNPAFRPVINEIGRRYRADDIDTFSFGIWGQAMF